MNIRPAVKADLSAVYALFEQELAYQKALIDGGDRIPNRDWHEVIDRKLTNSKERMWVAELNGNLVGYLMGRLSKSGGVSHGASIIVIQVSPIPPVAAGTALWRANDCGKPYAAYGVD